MKNIRPRVNEEEHEVLKDYRAIVKESKNFGIDPKSVKHGWFKSKTASFAFTNPLYKEIGIKEAFEEILKDYSNIQPVEIDVSVVKTDKALKIVLTDEHIGLDVNGGLFEYEYTPEIHEEKIKQVIADIKYLHKCFGHFDYVIICNYGDFQDGYENHTTRGGHHLSQNISTAEVFKHCLKTRLNMLQTILKLNVASKVILLDCVNDNHSGSFAHTISVAIQMLIEQLYKKDLVEVQTLDKFLDYRIYGNHAFIMTHGKDKEFRKHGLPLNLDKKSVEFLMSYIEHHGINKEAKYIHVEKGDLHSINYDGSRKYFDYMNFGSFAPPSKWAQANYGDCRSSYYMQVVDKKENLIFPMPRFLDYKKKVQKEDKRLA